MQRPYKRRYLPPNNMKENKFGDFEYFVTQQPPPRICFGSGLERDALPDHGPALSSFMRRIVPEVQPNIGPGLYENNQDAFYRVTTRHYSKYGLGSKAPRFTTKRVFQPPLRPLPPAKPLPQNCAPFNATGMRKPLFVAKEYPAPCDYDLSFKKKEIKFAYSFQGKKTLLCPVHIKCVPYNLDACAVCGCSCSAQGDYWQLEDRISLCRKHYNRLFKHSLAKFQGTKLADFKSVRDCFFMHMHNSCKAAFKIMKNQEIIKKLRKEAYLDLYFPQRRPCD